MKRQHKGLLAVILILACVGIGLYGFNIYSPAPRLPLLSAQARREYLQVGDRQRSFIEYAPRRLSPGAALIIVFHGSSMSGSKMRQMSAYEFDLLADQKQFVVAYPDGYRGNWNDCRKRASYAAVTEHIDDIGFTRSLIEYMARTRHIDPHKVFAVGYSNGAHMVFKLATEAPHEIAAFAAVGANLPTVEDSSCHPTGPETPVMLVNGTEDPINPFQGGSVTLFGFGKRGNVMSSVNSAMMFVQRNAADLKPLIEKMPHRNVDDPTWVERTTWRKAGKDSVVLYTIHGGGHVIPQPGYRFPRLLGKTSQDLDMPKEAMTFFGLP